MRVLASNFGYLFMPAPADAASVSACTASKAGLIHAVARARRMLCDTSVT